MPLATDQIGREIAYPESINRIVSLVPSQTELLFDLGLASKVVGRTRFCIHPEQVEQIEKIGGTKNPDIEAIKRLSPDLIIANKEENRQEDIQSIESDFPVWVSDVANLKDCLEMILELGIVLNRESESRRMIATIERGFSDLESSKFVDIPAAYLIWRKPYMVAAGDTFISDVMRLAGLSNVFESESRYPKKSTEELCNSEAEVFLLSSEPYRFRQKHVEELERAIPGKKALLVDGELFSWYGSRIAKAPSYLRTLREELRSNQP